MQTCHAALSLAQMTGNISSSSSSSNHTTRSQPVGKELLSAEGYRPRPLRRRTIQSFWRRPQDFESSTARTADFRDSQTRTAPRLVRKSYTDDSVSPHRIPIGIGSKSERRAPETAETATEVGTASPRSLPIRKSGMTPVIGTLANR